MILCTQCSVFLYNAQCLCTLNCLSVENALLRMVVVVYLRKHAFCGQGCVFVNYAMNIPRENVPCQRNTQTSQTLNGPPRAEHATRR